MSAARSGRGSDGVDAKLITDSRKQFGGDVRIIHVDLDLVDSSREL